MADLARRARLGDRPWFVQRYFDNSLSYDSPQADKIRNAVKRAN